MRAPKENSANPRHPKEVKDTPTPPCAERAVAAACESADSPPRELWPRDAEQLEEASEVKTKKGSSFTLSVSSATLVAILAGLPEHLRRPVLHTLLEQGSLAVDAGAPCAALSP